MNLQSTDETAGQEIDIGFAYALLWSRRWLIVLLIALFSAGAAIAANFIRPVYRATTVLMPASSERNNLSSSLTSALGSLGGLASLAGVSTGTNDSATVEALAVLRSRAFTQAFINDNNLARKLFSDKWDQANDKWRGATDDQPTPAQAFKYFDENLRSVVQDRKTGLVSLQIDWRDREEAAIWANQLTQRLNGEMRRRAIATADSSLGFLESELSSTTLVETRGAINHLVETQIRQRMLANVSPDFAFRVVDKAVPPDANDPIWPKKLLLTIAGAICGLIAGVILVLAFARPPFAATRKHNTWAP